MNNEVNTSATRRRIRRVIRNGNGGDPTTAGNGNGIASELRTDSTSTKQRGNEYGSDTPSGNGDKNNSTSGDSQLTFEYPGRESEPDRGNGDYGSSGTTGNDDGGDSASTRNGSGRGSRRGSEGTPRRVNRSRSKQKTEGTFSVKEDEDDLTNLIVSLGDGAANGLDFPGFKVSDEEARSIARPAARILQRHGNVAEAIRSVADPVALCVAGASVVVPRVAGFIAYKQYVRSQDGNYTPGNGSVPHDNVVNGNFKIDPSFASQFSEQ